MQDSKFGEHLYLTPRVPQGLAAAVEGLTREVIRHRPDNIYAFAVRHFENLLRLREQYGDNAPTDNKDKTTKHPHEVNNETARERKDDPKDANDEARQSGWTLNETAKVLDKHRSIFGVCGHKISTDQIRELANEPVLTSKERLKQGSPRRKIDILNEERLKASPGSSRRKECPHVTQDASRNGVKNAPRILSQIPIAKDIKTELRKNRISSREKKKVVACEYTRETIIEKSSTKSFEKTKKSYELRSERRSSRTEDSTKKRTETTKSRTNSQEDKKFSKDASMDSVKNYVLQNFVGMTSLNELQSPSYVEKVQEVIDETSSVIKEKVEALKSGVVRAAKAKNDAKMKKEMSASSEDQDAEKKSEEPCTARRNSKIAQDSVDKSSLDLSESKEVSEASESKSSLPAVRPPSSKSTSRSMSARSEADAVVTLPPISPESAKSPKVKEELVLPALTPPRADVLLDDVVSADDTTAAVEEIAEDVTVTSEKILDDRAVEELVTSGGSVDEEVVQKEESGDGIQVPSEDQTKENLVLTEGNVVEEEVPSADIIPGEIVPSAESLDGQSVPPEKSDNRESTEQVCNVEASVVEESDNRESTEQVCNVEASVVEESDKRESTEQVCNVEASVVEESDNRESAEQVCNVEASVVEESQEEKVVVTVPEIQSEHVEESVEVVDEKQASSELIVQEKADADLLKVDEEEFHDSLNITPEPFDTKGQRPDSLENSQVEDKSATSSGHVSPLETLKDKLLEIEQVQKRIEDVLDDTKSSKAQDAEAETDEATTSAKIADKLIEIQESEKRIEQILDSQSTSDAFNSDIKLKLQELEEVEKRIDDILEHEVIKESSDKIDTPVIDVEEIVEATNEDVDDSKAETTDANLSVPTIHEINLEKIEDSRAVSPHSYILTEGSPYEIPDSVTTVIIPDRTPSPPSESLPTEVEGEVQPPKPNEVVEEIQKDLQTSIHEAFGEVVESSEHSDTSTVDIEYIRGIKASHDMIVSRENLDQIKEERDEAEVIDSEDEKVLKVVTSSLEEILEKEEVEYVTTEEVQQMVKFIEEDRHESLEAVENSVESTARSAESTNEVKETSLTSDHTSLSLDPAIPMVPELNLDSLADLTISSFVVTEKDSSRSEASNKVVEPLKKDDSLDAASEAETQEFEKLEECLQRSDEPTAASDIGLPEADINNVVCQSAKENENNLFAAATDAAAAAVPESQCTETTTDSIEENNRHSEELLRESDVDEKKSYHIYVPEASGSKDVSSSSETSTFMSAATKIQAGVRGFLTRRRLQSTQKRSSTLDSVPSIQESFAVETSVTAPLMPIVETTSSLTNEISEAKARKKLKREDAVQRTTLSVENAFAENQLQHTGEFHDCIPLPVFDSKALAMKSMKERLDEKVKEAAAEVEQFLEKIILGHAATNFSAHPKLVDVVLLPPDPELQNKYLNFITSVEDVFTDLPETPKGVIIEEITSLDDSKSISEEVKKNETTTGDEVEKPTTANDGEETLASISTSEDPLSINIEEVLGLGEEDESSRKSNRLNVKLNSVDQLRSSSVSQDSPVSDERTRSPVTMMQIGPKSVDDKSEENQT